MSTPVVQDSPLVGGDLLLKGIRHLSNHESVICVLHVEDGDIISTAENQTAQDKSQRKKKISSGKSVHFNFLETESCDSDSCDRSSTTSSNSSLDEETSSIDSKMSETTANDIKTSVTANGLSPRTQRKKKGLLKPSPLLTDSTEKIGTNSPKTHKKSVVQSPATQRKSVDKLGLSPRIRRKGSAKAPSVDELSSNKPSKKHSWPTANIHMKYSEFPPAPLHSGFIGSEEELEKLRFIKNALSPLPAPISPEQFRKRSSTFGEDSSRNILPAVFRERSSTLEDGSKKEVYSKYNSLTMKIQVANANNKRKPRYGSAH